MKTLLNHLKYEHLNGRTGIIGSRQSDNYSLNNLDFHSGWETVSPKIRPLPLLTEDAALEMANGTIPDLEAVCRELYDTFFQQNASYNALQFIPVLKKLTSLKKGEVARFFHNPKTNHVLVRNEFLKVVLIHWKPGQISSIHGHPQGGCVFKVLQGSLEEKRYSPDASQQLLGVSTCLQGSMAYIDDTLAYHAVGNPFTIPAVSLHVYTPGGQQPIL